MNDQLLAEIGDIENLDEAGRFWSKKNYRNGYTSYASANEMHRNSPTFALLESELDKHVSKFTRALDMNLGGKKLRMNTCWVNVMRKDAQHGMHLHPLSVISGTYYVFTPSGASPIKFEDPRLSKFMASPPKKKNSRSENQYLYELKPKAGMFILFESWLRHEVPTSQLKTPRVSISFNYGWD